MFFPLMQAAARNSRVGREASHLVLHYKHVLSPANIAPSAEELGAIIEHGKDETGPHIDFIRKMLGPIPDPKAPTLT